MTSTDVKIIVASLGGFLTLVFGFTRWIMASFQKSADLAQNQNDHRLQRLEEAMDKHSLGLTALVGTVDRIAHTNDRIADTQELLTRNLLQGDAKAEAHREAMRDTLARIEAKVSA